MNQEQTKSKNEQPQWDKEFEEFGGEAVNRIKELVEEGKVRRLVLRRANNEGLLDVPLMPALVVGGLITLWMPYLTIFAVIVALVARLKLEIVHTETVDEDTESVEVKS